MRGTLKLLLAAAVAATVGVLAVGAQARPEAAVTARYIVQFDDAPLASYRGGVAGLAATNPQARGERRLDPASAASTAYLAHLAQRHDAFKLQLTQTLGHAVATPFTYRHAFNGMALVLTDAEAARVAALPGVKRVQKEFVRQPATDAGPAWIGAPSIWDGSQTGGVRGTKGEGIVAGIIDTGINHDHPSFADVGGDGYNHRNPRGTFYGLCAPITGLPFCNDKLIGVWDFTGTSPEDDNQHGSHTASTVAGNVLDAELNAPTISLTRHLSGVAPHANLITYKACIAVGCLGASLTAAIDQATADMVDVINYSIGGGPADPWTDSDSQAFLGARDAGIFVSVSAGNDGPKAETVGSPANSPWVLSVGASTHNRAFVNSLTGMAGGGAPAPPTMTGRGLTSGLGTAPIVYAGDFGFPLCGDGPAAPTGEAAVNPFPPGTFDGEIVVCDRGVYGRVEKASNVAEGGAGGFVLANDQASGDSLTGDAYPIPGVHVTYTDGGALKAWLAQGSGHTAGIAGATADLSPANGDVMAAFSSRGPNKPVPGVIKPDITAPGVDVLAAVNTTNPLAGPEFGVLSGTSMSSPHMAGSAVLIRALHGDWTPAEVQSALMTTAKSAGVRKEDGLKAADAFDMGSGRVDLTRAGRAGLVLDEQAADFAAADPAADGDPTALNLASLGSGDCDGTCTWTRTVRSTLGSSATWTARTTVPANLGLTVSPSRFTIAPNGTQTLTITADVRKLPVGQWIFADVRLVPSGGAAPEAHLPLAVLTGAAQLVDIEATATTGDDAVAVTPKIAIKNLQTTVYGLTEGLVETFLVEQDPTPLQGPYDVPLGTATVLVDVPAGSKFLAAEVGQTTATDVDLFVGRDSNGDGVAEEAEELCRSASETAAESCRLVAPEGGTYWILVQNWLGLGADDIEVVSSVIPGTNAGNLVVSGPRSAPANKPFGLVLSWNEPRLEPGDTWFGMVELGSDRSKPNNVKALLVRLHRAG